MWRQIKEFPMYEVSTEGQVRNIKTGHILKPYLNRCKDSSKSYYKVKLSIEPYVYKQVYVHRLVAMTFIPNDDESKDCVNHKDQNKLNNNVDNLEWVTRSENASYGTVTERRIAAYHRNRKKEIVKYDIDGNELARYPGPAIAAARDKDVTNEKALIAHLNDVGLKTYKGYVWRYEDKNE